MITNSQPISIFWFRRDLRIEDNVGLTEALNSDLPTLPLFIFDKNILDELDEEDARLTFIHQLLQELNNSLEVHGSGLQTFHGTPSEVFTEILQQFDVKKVYVNRDYEPYALQRDKEIETLLAAHDIELLSFKDQVIIEKDEVVKSDGSPYTVFTPFKKRWLQQVDIESIQPQEIPSHPNWFKTPPSLHSLHSMGFKKSEIRVRPYALEKLEEYEETRNIPSLDQTSYLSPHLRFGSIGIRSLFAQVKSHPVFVSELIWREFFMQILYHFPEVVEHNFKRKYDGIDWENNSEDFEKWCNGTTGYPMVDAGMRQLNKTGYMHNRVRMVTASFLCKHLLIDWRWGEAYFASKLLDYELSSNNGNWQWAAGTGCDAAPYFRIFNPIEQLKRFDPQMTYVRKWIPELRSKTYPEPMIDHKFARNRALERYKRGIN